MAENVLSLKAVDDFTKKLVRPRFFSFSALQIALRKYMTINFVVFVRINSQKSSDSKLSYEKAFYRCSGRPCRQSQGRGIRRSYSIRCTGCPARFHVRRYNDQLMVTSYYLEHNHPRSKFIFDRLPVNRRLTNEELRECSALLKYGAPSSQIRQYVADHFGKVLTIQDVYSYRVKCRPPLLNDFQSIVTQLRECGHALLVESEGGRLSHFCFSRTQQIALFRRFPDVVNVDATHGTNRLGYKLYTFLVTDGMGTGRPAMYAFVESEHFAPLRKLYCLFKEMMGGVLSRLTMSLVVSVANQLTLLTAGVREIDYHTTVIAAVTSLAHCVEKIFRCAHQSQHRKPYSYGENNLGVLLVSSPRLYRIKPIAYDAVPFPKKPCTHSPRQSCLYPDCNLMIMPDGVAPTSWEVLPSLSRSKIPAVVVYIQNGEDLVEFIGHKLPHLTQRRSIFQNGPVGAQLAFSQQSNNRKPIAQNIWQIKVVFKKIRVSRHGKEYPHYDSLHNRNSTQRLIEIWFAKLVGLFNIQTVLLELSTTFLPVCSTVTDFEAVHCNFPHLLPTVVYGCTPTSYEKGRIACPAFLPAGCKLGS
ncbi:hypothetical protein CLF_103699 [Clonorchis sinensis]|uniref:WRKY domain-containing protein n=1 Tax=Clonorchis sinensis TaxID=79923 RepID=G7YA85_CLOSI|nr:hypothetical protein CLF_103699 [Clonorchis sinensis]